MINQLYFLRIPKCEIPKYEPQKYNWLFYSWQTFCLLGQQDDQPETCDHQIFSGSVFAAKKDNSMNWLTLGKLAPVISVSCCQTLVFFHILIWQLFASLTNHKYTSANFFYLAWWMVNYLPTLLFGPEPTKYLEYGTSWHFVRQGS